jgi:hypothetical protein
MIKNESNSLCNGPGRKLKGGDFKAVTLSVSYEPKADAASDCFSETATASYAHWSWK